MRTGAADSPDVAAEEDAGSVGVTKGSMPASAPPPAGSEPAADKLATEVDEAVAAAALPAGPLAPNNAAVGAVPMPLEVVAAAEVEGPPALLPPPLLAAGAPPAVGAPGLNTARVEPLEAQKKFQSSAPSSARSHPRFSKLLIRTPFSNSVL